MTTQCDSVDEKYNTNILYDKYIETVELSDSVSREEF